MHTEEHNSSIKITSKSQIKNKKKINNAEIIIIITIIGNAIDNKAPYLFYTAGTIMNKLFLVFILATGLLTWMPASAISKNASVKWKVFAIKKSNGALNIFTPTLPLAFNWDPTTRRFIGPASTLIIQTLGNAAYKISTQLMSHQLSNQLYITTTSRDVPPTESPKNTSTSSEHIKNLSIPGVNPLPSNADTHINFVLNPNMSPAKEEDIKDLRNGAYQGEIELLLTAQWATNSQ